MSRSRLLAKAWGGFLLRARHDANACGSRAAFVCPRCGAHDGPPLATSLRSRLAAALRAPPATWTGRVLVRKVWYSAVPRVQ